MLTQYANEPVSQLYTKVKVTWIAQRKMGVAIRPDQQAPSPHSSIVTHQYTK